MNQTAEQTAAASENSSADKAWYAVHVSPGFERPAKEWLERSTVGAESVSEFRGRFGEVLLPTEQVMEIQNGKRVTVERKFYPGYLFVEMEMDADTFRLVKSAPKVTGFVGEKKIFDERRFSAYPFPPAVRAREIEGIKHRMREGAENPQMRSRFEIGEQVRVCDGPFADFAANVEEINSERNKLKVSVMIFGRPTAVELDFEQVEKQ